MEYFTLVYFGFSGFMDLPASYIECYRKRINTWKVCWISNDCLKVTRKGRLHLKEVLIIFVDDVFCKSFLNY